MKEYIDNADDGVQSSTDGEEHSDGEGKQQPNPGAIRKSTTQGILKAAAQATGMQFNSVEDMMTAIARMSALANVKETQQPQQPQQSQQSEESGDGGRKRVTNNDLAEKYEQLRREMQDKERKLLEKQLDDQIRGSMGDRFDPAFMDYSINKIRSQLVEQDGEWIVVNGRQQQRYHSEGRPMTVRDLIEELAADNPKLLRQSAPMGGSGLRPQGGAFSGGLPGDGEVVPDYTKDPAAFNAWAARKGLGKNTGLRSIGASVYNSTSSKKVY